jgi:tetratricopeptide (TPR) repeat protein
MHPYGVRDVERLLGLTRGTLRSLIDAGFVTPERGPRNAWRFSFQDLIVLRTAQALVAAKVPARRITKSLRDLRRQLPDSMPLSGLSIGAVGDRVVVRQGGGRWQAESGQYLLDLTPKTDSLFRETKPREPEFSGRNKESVPGVGWFEKGLALEGSDAKAALQAYAKAIAADPRHVDAHINMALLLHEAQRLPEAERAYRAAIDACGNDAMLLFNFAVLLEDMDRLPEAVRACEAALRSDPRMADGHYNLALLHEKLGRPREALRHMSQYRRLTGAGKK